MDQYTVVVCLLTEIQRMKAEVRRAGPRHFICCCTGSLSQEWKCIKTSSSEEGFEKSQKKIESNCLFVFCFYLLLIISWPLRFSSWPPGLGITCLDATRLYRAMSIRGLCNTESCFCFDLVGERLCWPSGTKSENRQRQNTQLRHSKVWIMLSIRLSSGNMNADAPFGLSNQNIWYCIWKGFFSSKLATKNAGIYVRCCFIFM